MLGTLKVSGTEVDAPMARGPTARGRVGLASVTVPVPPRLRRVTWLMLTVWAAVKPLLVSCQGCRNRGAGLHNVRERPLKFGAPHGPEAATDVEVSADVFEPSMFPVRSVALL